MALGLCLQFGNYFALGTDNLIRQTSFRAIRKSMGLLRTRQQGHTVESIRDAMVELQEHFPLAGARDMASILFHEKDLLVLRY
jgi:hypothetical protein